MMHHGDRRLIVPLNGELLVAKGNDRARDVDELLKRNADEERRLLKRERQAEQEVAELRGKLEAAVDSLSKAQKRVARRTKVLAKAEAELQRQRTARVSGPATAPVGAEPPAAEPPPAATPKAPVPPPSPRPRPEPTTDEPPATDAPPRRRRRVAVTKEAATDTQP